MPDYSNGKIYKVINTQHEIIYIGSTVQTLSCRFSKHTHKGNGNKIVLIEKFPCSCKEELLKKEQEIIEQNDNLLNKYRAYNSEEYNKNYKVEYDKQYRIDNIEKKKMYDKKWNENNKEKKSANAKEWREKNKETIKEKHNIWYENNRQTEREKGKLYWIENKDRLQLENKNRYEKNKVKVNCELCNCEILKYCLKKHQKTQKCITNRI